MQGDHAYQEAKLQLLESLKDETNELTTDDAWKFFKAVLSEQEVMLPDQQCSVEDALFMWTFDHLEKYATIVELQTLIQLFANRPKRTRP